MLAHALSVPQLAEYNRLDWSDEALDARVAAGEASAGHAEHVKAELPSPRVVEIPPIDVVFDGALDLDLGSVTVRVRHVGGDHCVDACVMLVEEDRLLFLGDCLCASPSGQMTREHALPLFDTILDFEAEAYVEGHHEAVTSRAELEALIAKAQRAAAGESPGDDEDSRYFADAFAPTPARTLGG